MVDLKCSWGGVWPRGVSRSIGGITLSRRMGAWRIMSLVRGVTIVSPAGTATAAAAVASSLGRLFCDHDWALGTLGNEPVIAVDSFIW